MKLVIVESPAKAKTIEKYLGKGYQVKASKGHIVDLPKSQIGVDFDNKYAPTYEVTKPAALKELKQAYKAADELIIATDLDREGEAIGWHIARELKNLKAKRIVFSEITKEAVQRALENGRSIDLNLVNAQEARRILDRIVGYKLSPLLWKKIRYGLSAGRVQSVAVRLIVEREDERLLFKPDEYWKLLADLSEKNTTKKPKLELKLKDAAVEIEGIEEDADPDNIDQFVLTHYKNNKVELKSQTDVEKVYDKTVDGKWIVKSIVSKENRRNPKPPFITATLQRTAASKYGYSAKRTMQIAQGLYERGLITYMRTDSVNLATEAVEKMRKVIEKKWGKDYLPAKPIHYQNKSKSAQEAHEAIRATDPAKDATGLGLVGDDIKLYELIRTRGLASQMLPAVLMNTQYVVDVNDYQFSANTQQIQFKGYLAAYYEKVEDVPALKVSTGNQLYPSTLTGKQSFTEPPPRYTESSLIKKLEEEGIGRPSTYAAIVSTILTRGYVVKEGNSFVPTDTGRVVNKLLVGHFNNIVDVKFTAGMEDQLDEIAEGKLNWVKMLDQFYLPFADELVKQDSEIKKADFVVLEDAPDDIVCPTCGGKMQVKLGRYGRFYSCVRFPECDGIRSLDGKTESDIQAESTTDEFKNTYEPAPLSDDGKPYLLKKGRYGQFWAHPEYPKVKDAKPLVYLRSKLIELFGEVPQTKDGRDFLLRKGRFGEFWAHPDYPTVKEIQKIGSNVLKSSKKSTRS